MLFSVALIPMICVFSDQKENEKTENVYILKYIRKVITHDVHCEENYKH